MNIILYVLLNERNDTLKEIEQNIFHQNSFSHMISKRIILLMFSKSVQVKNPADLFTKALPTTIFKKLVRNIRVRRLKDLD